MRRDGPGPAGTREDAAGPTRSWFRRFVLLALTLPTSASALGVDGGALFQIVAVENLGLSPAAIGSALGLGVVSVPLQLWAARLRLGVARRNLLTFLVFTTAACWTLAALVAIGGAGPAGTIALVVTVLAEVALSVLFATSWQPLLSVLVPSRQRQALNSRGRAAGGIVLVVVLLVFGSAGVAVRVGLLLAVGAAASCVAVVLRGLPVPSDDAPLALPDPSAAGAPDRSVVPLLVLAGFAAASHWPLFPVYVAEVSWPTADLGVVGAVGTAAGLVVGALWRATDESLMPRARAGAGVVLAAALTFVLAPTAVTAGAADLVALVAYGAGVAGRSVLLISMLEIVHRAVSPRTTVRVLTLLDVVASSCLQLGLFVGGLLVTWSTRNAWGPVDPYQAWTLLVAVGTCAALARVARSEGPVPYH